MQILALASFAAAIDIQSAIAARIVAVHAATGGEDPPPETMDGINQFRAEQCAGRPEPWKHKECLDFMKKACNPSGIDGTEGEKPQMNGEEGEVTTGKGFCKKFFNAQKEEEEKKKKEDERIPKLEEELKKSEEELKKAKDELEECQSKYHELELKCASDKKKLEDELEAAMKEIAELKKKLAERKDDIEEPSEPKTTTTTTTSTTAPIIQKQIAETKTVAGLPLYKPPNQNGVQDEEGGWDYLENGKNWPSMCADTEGQSPVDISRDIDIEGQTKSILWFDYYADPDREKKQISSYLVNQGHGITFEPPEDLDLGYVKLYKSQYTCKEYTFHSPSEHTLDGARFPLEIQIMNKDNDSDQLLGVALFFREGKTSNKFIAALMEAAGSAPRWNMASSAKSVNASIRDAFDLNLLVPKSEQHPGGHLTFYNYEGSLTSPPCTKGVDWWVSAKPLTATKEEITYIQNAILESPSTKHGNNRETQPLNGRTIRVGMTNFQDAVKMPGYHGSNADSVQEPRGFSTQDSPW